MGNTNNCHVYNKEEHLVGMSAQKRWMAASQESPQGGPNLMKEPGFRIWLWLAGFRKTDACQSTLL